MESICPVLEALHQRYASAIWTIHYNDELKSYTLASLTLSFTDLLLSLTRSDLCIISGKTEGVDIAFFNDKGMDIVTSDTSLYTYLIPHICAAGIPRVELHLTL